MFGRSRTRERPFEEQVHVEQQCESLILYQTRLCPYCIKVRREMDRLQLSIKLRDVGRYPEYRQQLIREGGRSMVPCLRIEDVDGSVKWMYESDDINRYLRRRFAPR